jgi:gluconokinase
MAGDVQPSQPAIIVVMGVAGAGKTTVGQLVSQQIGWTFVEADDYHSPANRAKLSAGIPLTDEDRSGWLRTLNDLLREATTAGTPVVLACSALAARYRTALVGGLQGVLFVYLRVTPETARNRAAARRHFFHPALVASQFQTLEEPNDALVIDGSRPALEIVAEIRQQLFTEQRASSDHPYSGS